MIGVEFSCKIAHDVVECHNILKAQMLCLGSDIL